MGRYPLTPGMKPGRPARRPFFRCEALPGVEIPGQLIGIGENYRPDVEASQPAAAGHPGESRHSAPTRIPLVFGKFPGSLAAHGQPILLRQGVSEQVVCEGELAVVIGTTLKDALTAEAALEAVAGLTVANDVSARLLQAADVQSTRGKSLDTFCPLGPDMVTLDELSDVAGLRIITRINGLVVQDSSVERMVFPVQELVMFCSQFMTLYPGDVILTGTPWVRDESVLALRPGDTVSVEIPGVGLLENPVAADV